MFIPISTDTSIRRTPRVNYFLIVANIVVFLVPMILHGSARHPTATGAALARWIELGVLDGAEPQLYQFFTYQFLHANFAHIAGNMLFLWIFGNPVNAKMGDGPYLLFYLAGGIFAAAGYCFYNEYPLVGASGSIATVTTAYLALFPRSHIRVLYWWFFIGTFELPSIWMIGIKLILWDNFIDPRISGAGNIAFGAHLAGYAFGFAGAVCMLAIHALPRDQFDIVALWRRWLQRQGIRSALSTPESQARAQYGQVARPISLDQVRTTEGPVTQLDPITELRLQVAEALSRNDRDTAAQLYEKILELDPKQVLARTQQLDVANQLVTLHRLPQAAASYEKFLSAYPSSAEAVHVRLMLGIIYTRDLQQYEVAEGHLTLALHGLTDDKRREQCLHWLNVVAKALGKQGPETAI